MPAPSNWNDDGPQSGPLPPSLRSARSGGPASPFPDGERAAVGGFDWFDDEPSPAQRRPPREFHAPDEQALASPRELATRLRSSSALNGWLWALLAAAVAAGVTYTVARPDPPTRTDAVAAVVAAADAAGRVVTEQQAGCIVDDLAVEGVSYETMLSSAVPPEDLRRAYHNAYFRCAVPPAAE
jgi:hypothetical protein